MRSILEIDMHTWDVAKLLLTGCESPKDVEQVVALLRDPSHSRDICALLSSFTIEIEDLNTHGALPTVSERDADARQLSGRKGPKPPLEGPGFDIALQLEPVFRSRGMTNYQVEQWVSEKTGLDTTVGKTSLRAYLGKLINREGLAFGNQLLSRAWLEIGGVTSENPDLADYWDQLNKRSFPAQ